MNNWFDSFLLLSTCALSLGWPLLFIPWTKIVPEYERILVFRLGRLLGVKGPGIVFLYPGMDRIVRVDVRETIHTIVIRHAITRDNIAVTVHLVIGYLIVKPELFCCWNKDGESAIDAVSQGISGMVLSQFTFQDLLAPREYVSQKIRISIDEIVERWGVKASLVEIQEVIRLDSNQRAELDDHTLIETLAQLEKTLSHVEVAFQRLLGLNVGLLGFATVFMLSYWAWLVEQPIRPSLYVTAALIIGSLSWATLDRARRRLALSLVGIGSLLLLVQLFSR